MRTAKTASHVVGLAWLAASVGVASTSCKKDEAPPPPVAAPVAKPVDHLAPGELVEGPTKAFGLPMPRGFEPRGRLSNQISGELLETPENVSNYVRARVGDGRITMGSTSTTFARVRPRADPQRLLDIRVEKTHTGARIEVTELTASTAPPPSNQPDALKTLGLSPTGRPDPQMQ